MTAIQFNKCSNLQARINPTLDEKGDRFTVETEIEEQADIKITEMKVNIARAKSFVIQCTSDKPFGIH